VSDQSPIQATADGIRLQLRIQPRASRDDVAGVLDGRLRVRLSAPPVAGAANEACLRFLAELFDVPRSAVRLRKGQRARDKTVSVRGDAPTLAARLESALRA
jgi:uncharacterized protein (TIGR00251 family)